MSRRQPHPREPDVHDDRRELADAIFADQAATIEAGGKINAHMSALYWLGYRDWGIAHSFTPPDSTRRRARLLNDFHGKPFHAELERHLNGIGWSRPPDREAEPRAAPLDAYVEIDGNVVRWGFRDTPGRELIFKAHCERFELVVLDGDAHVAHRTSTEWDNEITIESLGLTDDDYRFEVSAGKDGWWGSTLRFMRHRGEWFDFAEIDGVWVELEFQGREWDGEWTGSQRTHTAADRTEPADAPAEPSDAEKRHAAAEAERAHYANRKARANMRVVAMAQRNFNGDKLHPGRHYGANWFRTLWALGHRPRVWHGSLVQPEPTEPFTAADARREERVWDGWRPFREELERLERDE